MLLPLLMPRVPVAELLADPARERLPILGRALTLPPVLKLPDLDFTLRLVGSFRDREREELWLVLMSELC